MPQPPRVPAAAPDETVELSPFEVRASTDNGYQATETLAGSRMATSLKDVPTQINVMTPEFLQDLSITDLADAIRYSINTENLDDTFPLENPNNAALQTTINYNANPTRTRNLGQANATHDFFDTNLRIDSYNTERLTFASGPNSILFGNSRPGGTIDSSLKRASTTRRRYSASIRVDQNESVRTVVDLDQPLIKNKLGMRVVTLRDRAKDWREPGYSNQDRYFGSIVAKPFKQVSLRGYYERVFEHVQAPVNTLMYDHITPWKLAGSPLFDNRPTPVPFPAATSVLGRERTDARTYLLFDSKGTASSTSPMVNMVTVKGYNELAAAPNNFEHSILDRRLYPFDISPAGNGNQSKLNGWNRGIVAEFNPIKNLFFELGLNQEQTRQRGAMLFRGTDLSLKVDVDQYLNDRVTPNPNLGRYYIESNLDQNAAARTNFSTRDQKRASAAYEFNFAQYQNWMKWLGRHRFAGLYEELTSVAASQNQDYRIVTSTGALVAGAAGQPVFRYYLSPGEAPYVRLPFDPLASGVQNVLGTPISGFDSPFGAIGRAGGNRKRQFSDTFTMQNSFLDNRIVTTYGERKDKTKLYQRDPGNTGVTAATVPGGGFISLGAVLDHTGLDWVKQRENAPRTSLKGIVVHPFRWLSLAYSEATSEIVGTAVPTLLNGQLAPQNHGVGKDYGFTLRLPNDRISLRYTRYQDSDASTPSVYRLNNPVGNIGTNLGDNLRHNVTVIDQAIQIASGQKGTSAKYQYFLDTVWTLAPGASPNAIWGGGNEELAFNSDRVSKGDEVAIVGNPTSQWRISVGLARSESKESNIAPEWQEYMLERIPVWEKYLDTKLAFNQNFTIKQLLEGGMVRNMNFIKYGEGKPLARERKYRVTAVSSYRFERGWLKGVSTGGVFSWRSPAAIGYSQKEQTNFYPIKGVVAGTMLLDDQEHPFRGGGLVTFDGWAGYERKLSKERIRWQVQLNIRNLLDRDNPQLQRITTSGEGAVYTLPAPRTFILTNTFTF